MRIDSLMLDDGPSIYYDDGFRRVLEDHMSYLRNLASTKQISVDAGKAFKYEFDFHGLCAEYGVPQHMHWLVTRINGFTSTTDFNGKIDYIFVPDFAVVERLRQSHMSTRKIA